MGKHIKFCPNCNKTKLNASQLFDDNDIINFYKGYLFFYNIEDENSNICPCCKNIGLIDSVLEENEFEIIQKCTQNRQVLESMVELKKSNVIEFELKLNQFKLQFEQQNSIKQTVEQKSSSSQKLTCPKCGSTNITEGTRGFTLTTGFIGSGNFRYVCKKCGNKWKLGSMLEILQRANNGN